MRRSYDDAPRHVSYKWTTAQICENGHKITSDAEGMNSQRFCSQCGAKTISCCPSCSSRIRGKKIPVDSGRMPFPSDSFSRPNFCVDCGEQFPWIKANIDRAIKIAQASEEFNPDEIENIRILMPYAVNDSSRTEEAGAFFGAMVSRLKGTVKNQMQNALFEFATKKALLGASEFLSQ